MQSHRPRQQARTSVFFLLLITVVAPGDLEVVFASTVYRVHFNCAVYFVDADDPSELSNMAKDDIRRHSMPQVDRFKLLRGPYYPPKARRGSRLFCEIRGTVIVGYFSNGPIPWPRMKNLGTAPYILCGDLVKAVKCESGVAIAHHFGVSTQTVKWWRRALGVPRANEGSVQLWGRVASAREDGRLERARRNSKRPAALAKLSAKLKGRTQSPGTIAAVRKAARRPRSAEWKAKMAAYWRKRGHPPGHPKSRFWTPQEEALLGTDTDAKIGNRIGRSVLAVADHRIGLGIPRFSAAANPDPFS